jgi:hypothetical protein
MRVSRGVPDVILGVEAKSRFGPTCEAIGLPSNHDEAFHIKHGDLDLKH